MSGNRSLTRSRGTAMIEFVLVLPLLLLIMMLVLFFGRGMVRAQHSIAMTHYELWRSHMPARHVIDGDSWPAAPAADAPLHDALNSTFLGGQRATTVNLSDTAAYPYRAGERLVDAAVAHEVADIIGDLHFNRSVPGRTLTSRVTRSESVPLWQQFDPQIRHTQIGFGHPFSYVYGLRVTESETGVQRWSYDPSRRRDPNVMATVRAMYLEEFDRQLAGLPGPGGSTSNPLAQRLRDTYGRTPSYVGPQVGRQ